MAHLLACREPGGFHRSLEVVRADIIGAPFEQGDAGTDLERIAHRGQIALEQLVLQGLGAGRDNHLAAGQQCGSQVSKGLAGTRTCFGHQYAIVLDGRGDLLRHLQLLGTRAKTLDGGCQGAFGRKEAGEISHGGRRIIRRPVPAKCVE